MLQRCKKQRRRGISAARFPLQTQCGTHVVSDGHEWPTSFGNRVRQLATHHVQGSHSGRLNHILWLSHCGAGGKALSTSRGVAAWSGQCISSLAWSEPLQGPECYLTSQGAIPVWPPQSPGVLAALWPGTAGSAPQPQAPPAHLCAVLAAAPCCAPAHWYCNNQQSIFCGGCRWYGQLELACSVTGFWLSVPSKLTTCSYEGRHLHCKLARGGEDQGVRSRDTPVPEQQALQDGQSKGSCLARPCMGKL